MPRELRVLVPIEIVAIAAVAVWPLPETVPVAMPLLIAAVLSRWARGRALTEPRATGVAWPAAIGIAVGLAALGLALSIAMPATASYPMVRGNVTQTAIVALVVVAIACASELALRGWIVERALELRAPPALAIAVGAVAEALVTSGDLRARLGAAMFGAGLGWMYVASGRSVIAPIAARIAFALGALVLEATRFVG